MWPASVSNTAITILFLVPAVRQLAHGRGTCSHKPMEKRMKVYYGVRTKAGCVVTVDGAPLNPCLSHGSAPRCPFEWGFSGDGPLRLALSLLVSALDNDERALRLHKAFMESVLARMCGPGVDDGGIGDNWLMNDELIGSWAWREEHDQASQAVPDRTDAGSSPAPAVLPAQPGA